MLETFDYKITAKVWKYEGKGAWFFVTIPKTEGDQMKEEYGKKRGWGSVPITVRVGTSVWATSIFPDTKTATYLLPLKADIRKRQNIHENDDIEVECRVRGRKNI
jgi:hypothetical protein